MLRTGVCGYNRRFHVLSLLIAVFLFTYVQGLKELRFITEPSSVSVLPGGDATLHCEVTEDNTRVQWRWAPALPLDEAPILDPIGDLHRTFHKNGSLQLFRVGPSGASAGDYQCLVTREGQGTIVSRVATVSLPNIPIFDAEPRDLVVYPKEAAFFACLVRSRVPPWHMGPGRPHSHNSPSPDIKIQWLKNDAPLRIDETRMTVLPSGALEIDPVTVQDRGAYRCNVTMDGGSGFRLSNKAQLTINTDMTLAETFMAPTFLAKPNSQTVVEGVPAIMDCAALGNPRPDIIWLNNGFAIDLSDLDSRFRVLGSGSLYITSTKESDAGAYQCRADNTEDSLDATAVLTVQVPPRFKKKPRDMTAVERQDLEFECEVYGKPEPTIRWLKNGEVIIPNNHDMALVDGYNLRIQGLMASDAGMFQCVASNPAGNIQASAELIVLSAGPVSKKNKNKNSKFHKRKPIPTDALEKEFYSDHPVTSQLDRNLKKKSEHSKFDSSGMPFDVSMRREIFTSLISSDSVKGDAIQMNSDIEKVNDKLDSDTKHKFETFESLSHNAFDNLAESESDNHSNPLALPAFTSTISIISNNTDTNIPNPSLTNSFNNPETGIMEEPALNGSMEEGEVDLKKTPSEPQQFMALIVKARFVTLSWSEPQVTNGEIIAYSVIYRIKGSVRERIMNTTRGDIYKMNVPSLQPNTLYHFRAVAYNKNGAGPMTQILEIATQLEELSLGPPQDVKVTAESPNVLSVSWTPPQPVPGSKVTVEKYELLWAEVETGDEHSVITTELSHRLSDLHPFTEYSVRVAALGAGEGSGSSGSPSEQVVLRTPGDAPSAAPLNVSLTPHSSESILVQWEAPPPDTHNGDITGFKVKYKLHGRSGTTKGITTPADRRSVILQNLERMASYQIRLCAFNVNGSGPFTEWQTVETLQNDLDESQVPDAPGPLETHAGSESIHVSWTPPLKNQNIRVRGYTLSWGKGIPDEYIRGVEESARQYTITELEPNAEYVISVRASNMAGDGPPVYSNVRTKDPSEVEEDDDLGLVDLSSFEGKGSRGKPKEKQSFLPLIPPVGVKADILTSTTAVVYWTDTTLPKSQIISDQRRYEVRYAPVDSQKYRYHNATHLNCMIDDLKPHTQYEFTVRVVKGNRYSQWSMMVVNNTFEAAPGSAPRDVHVSPGTSPSYITLHWLAPNKANGAITGYVILYTTDRTKRDRDWIVQAVVGGGTSAVVRPLQPATPYHFKVQARNSAGYGPFSYDVTFTTPAGFGQDDVNPMANGKEMRHGPSLTIIIVAGCIVVLVLVAGIVLIVVCCKKSNASSNPTSSPDSRAKNTYQKASASNIKPPDLWIHHDQMELKQMDKSHHSTSGSGDGVSGVSSMTLPRPSRDSGCEYDTATPGGRPGPGLSSNQFSSLDKRHYVPTYVGSSSPTFGDASIGGNSSAGGNSSRNSAFLSSGGQSMNSKPTIVTKPKPLISLDFIPRESSMSSINACSLSNNPDTMPPPGMKPLYPRSQYAPGQMSRGHLNIDQNTPLLSAAGSSLSGTGTLPSQSSLSSIIQPPPSLYNHHHHHHANTSSLGMSPISLSSGMSCSVLGGGVGPAPSPSPSPASEGFPADAREREQGHYVAYEALHPPREGLEGDTSSLSRRGLPIGTAHPLRSFSVPAPPPSDAPHTPHHHVSVMIRPTNTSPYKKPLVPPVPISHPPPGSTLNRFQPGMHIPHTGDELEPLTSSCSTEQLHQEMVNLEGLMKDLSAITANQFEC